MDLRKLRHAVILSHWRNFTKAAQALNLTQSALSRSIQSLEKDLGLSLFERSKSAVSLTQAGREVIALAETMLRNEAGLRSVAAQAGTGHGGRAILGVTPLAARLLLPEVLSTRIGQPHFHAEIETATRPQLITMVMQERVDLCICASEDTLVYSGLSSEFLTRVTMGLIVRKDHPLTHVQRLSQEAVARYPMVRATPYGIGDTPVSVVGPLQSRPPAVTTEDLDVLSQVTADSDAIWVATPILADDGIKAGKLVELPITWLPEPPRMSYFAYFPTRRTLSPVTRSMIEHMKLVGEQISARGALISAKS